MKPTVRIADLGNEADAAALVEIIDSYARGPGGQNAPLTEHARGEMARGLAANSSAEVLLGVVGEEPVGVAVCVRSFSTFAGKPSVNIHDFAVLPDYRGRGVGHALLAEVERLARERGCCKITLEVHDTNEAAKRLYESDGFGPWDVPTLFVTKPL
jgi:ribosomal protein S18 acetylase RimI-like enzyme